MRKAGMQEHPEKAMTRWGSSVTAFQLDDQGFLVDRFQKTRPEAPVHLDRRANDSLGQRFVFQGHFSLSPALPGRPGGD